MKKPKISIVLPTYNGSRYLRESVNSVLSQSEQDWELIVVNDCSTDDTLRIAEEYAKKDSRITVFSNKTNMKLPATLNVGFSHARGKYLTWTSDDNLYKPNALKVMCDYLDTHTQTDAATFFQDLIDEHGYKMNKEWTHPRGIVNLIASSNWGAAFIYRRSIAQKIGEYDEKLFCAEDYDYFIRIALEGRVDYVDEQNIYLYRIHNNSLSTTKKAQQANAIRAIQEKYVEPFFAKYNIGYIVRAKLIYLSEIRKADMRFMQYWPMFFLFWWQKRIIKLFAVLLFPKDSFKRKAFRNKMMHLSEAQKNIT